MDTGCLRRHGSFGVVEKSNARKNQDGYVGERSMKWNDVNWMVQRLKSRGGGRVDESTPCGPTFYAFPAGEEHFDNWTQQRQPHGPLTIRDKTDR